VTRQITRTRPATLLYGLTLLGTFACKQEVPNIAAKDYPNQMASSYCEAVYGCSCESYPYVDFNECFADLSVAYDELNDAAYLAGLSYDGSCPAKKVEEIEALACKTWLPEPSPNVCVPPCYAWHGSLSAGAQCSVEASSAELAISFSNCAQGLECFSGVCVNPCELGGLPKLGEPCPDLVCDAGLTCDQTQVCVAQAALPGPGEACLDGLCDPDQAVCIADANVCGQLPPLGQPCVEGQCERGAYCGPDNVCLASPAIACGLLGSVGSGDGDGDGDPTTGDGDGDPTTGDGDGDPTTGDGDGEPGPTCTPMGGLGLGGDGATVVNGSTVGASDVYSGSCGGAGGNERVYVFVPPYPGTYHISVAAEFDSVLYMRDGNDCTGAELACDGDVANGLGSFLEVSFNQGNQYYTIFVDSHGESGDYSLYINYII
jgi:hypothetical protein